MKPRVVIVGAGFGGLWAARHLSGAPAGVLLVDRHNFHTFFPLLYQVAAAELGADDPIHPVRSTLRGFRGVSFRMANVRRIALERQALECDGGDVAYDYLVLAPGSIPQFFGIPGGEEYAFPLRSLEDSLALRNQVLRCFEAAASEGDHERRRRLLTFVIVGGGPTGVEYAGALAELMYGPLRKDFPGLDFREVRLLQLEAADAILPGIPRDLEQYARERLRKMGIDVRLGAAVAEITPNAVWIKGGETIPTSTVVWTAGHRGHSMAEVSGLPTTKKGQVEVESTLQVPGNPNIYVIGDLAAFNQGGRLLPMLGQVAIQEGRHAARNILRQLRGQQPEPFRYKDKGMMLVIGRAAAIAMLGGRNFKGFGAWILWLTVHLIMLIGFRNRLQVLLAWLWSYLFMDRPVRLIIPRGPAAVRTLRENGTGTDQQVGQRGPAILAGIDRQRKE